MEVEVITTYRCPFCKETYDTRQEAERCLAKGFKPLFEIGDIVVPQAAADKKNPHCRYGWFDGDKRWVYKDLPTAGLHGHRGIDFYYVVTHVEARGSRVGEGPHEPVYHVVTAAMTGRQGHVGGWTTQQGHIAMAKVDDPPKFVVRDSKRFIGTAMSNLL